MSAKRLNYKHVDYELDLNFAFINVFFKKKITHHAKIRKARQHT